ncbi:MAG: lysophospholipid acyltransferase family protein [Acidobacteriota bacterium]
MNDAGPDRETHAADQTIWRRLKISAASWIGTFLVAVLGACARWEIDGLYHQRRLTATGRRTIYVFWHGRILMATYFWRCRNIVVMTSQNFDGEYIARIIGRFGFGSARGSSSRGGVRALIQMSRVLKRGSDVAFTIDGPRGPRHVAKPGALWLARRSGEAILPFHIESARRRELRSWDRFQIPRLFSPTKIWIAPPIEVSPEASDSELEEKQRLLQETLDRLTEQGRRWVEQIRGQASGVSGQ